jgi:hypothetical protein
VPNQVLPAQHVQIANPGYSTSIAWTAGSTPSWLSVSPSAGSTPATIAVTVATTGLAPGAYQGGLPIMFEDSTQVTVTVDLQIWAGRTWLPTLLRP